MNYFFSNRLSIFDIVWMFIAAQFVLIGRPLTFGWFFAWMGACITGGLISALVRHFRGVTP